ncbi:MAG: hypothetical protein ACJ74Z_17150 [Bryobacteraceae bacterium]
MSAKVGVRVDDFRVYIKKLAEGETTVGSGLFAEMTTAQKQSESIAKILSERILAVVNGEVVRFSVGKPIPFRRSQFADAKNQFNAGAIGRLAYTSSPDQLAVFGVAATLDEAFLSNFVQTLNSVSTSKKRISTSGEPLSFWAMYKLSGNCTDSGSREENPSRKVMAVAQRFGGSLSTPFGSILQAKSERASIAPSNASQTASQQGDSTFCLPLLDRTPHTATVYRFSNVDHELAQYLTWTLYGGSFDVAGGIMQGRIKLPRLEIAVLDKYQKELQVELIEGTYGDLGQKTVALDLPYPWLLYYPLSITGNHAGAILLRQRTFNVVMRLNDEALRQAETIRVRLVR